MKRTLFCTAAALGAASALGAGSTASAQETGADSGTAVREVVITGSRIPQAATFTSPDPIQVITAEQSSLQGLTNTSQILQQSTVAGNGTQINNFFTGYVVNGGPGVNTVALRNLGADRTLVLLNGQRMGPAGVSGSVGAVDLNTIPSTIIDHIDILKDGSSSIYGSDAVAGVVNIVTKQNLRGFDFHGYIKPTDGGSEYDLSGAWGKTFDRGYVNLSGDYYEQQALLSGDRDYLSCTQDFAYAVDGSRLDLTDPKTGKPKCYNLFVDTIEDANTGYAYIPADAAAMGAVLKNDPPGLHRVSCTVRDLPAGPACSTNTAYPINVSLSRLSRSEVPYDDPQLGGNTAISPVKRYTANFSAGWDLIPERVQVYTDFMFNRRQSSQSSYRQIFPYLEPGNPSNIFNDINGDYELPIVLTPTADKQRVNYVRDLFGFRGSLPDFATVTNLHYDLSAQYSRSSGAYTSSVFLDDRVNATVAPTACDPTWSEDGGPTMESLGDNAACVPVDWTAASFNGRFSPAELAFLQTNDVGHTLYDQRYIQGDVNGELFQLPAGPLAADVGFMWRRDHINDVPGEVTLAGNLWNSTSSGITEGSDKTKEVFAELSIPVLKDIPFAKSLDFHVSGRYSDYDSVGTAKTYKASARWALTDWLAFKYVQGTSFRAPQLYELYLADQTGYLSQVSIDPCINYGMGAGSTLAANCAAAGVPSDYPGSGSSALIYTGGGLGNLKPETSLSRTTSVVLTPHWFGLDAGLEVDYYQNHIKNGIQQFGAGSILKACYNSSDYPTNGFCSLFTRDADTNEIIDVHDNYVNVASVIDRGIDATFFYRQNLPYDVKLRIDSQLSWTLKETTQLLGDSNVTDYNGTVGTPNFVGNINVKLTRNSWTLNWFTNFVGASNDDSLVSPDTASYRSTGVPGTYLIRTPFYAIHTVSVRKQLGDDLTIQAGIINVFDKAPYPYSYFGAEGLLGQAPLASQYDIVGRAAFLQIDKHF